LAWYHLQPIDSIMGEVYWRVPVEDSNNSVQAWKKESFIFTDSVVV